MYKVSFERTVEAVFATKLSFSLIYSAQIVVFFNNRVDLTDYAALTRERVKILIVAIST